MKKVLIFVLLFVMLTCASCGADMEFSSEVTVMRSFLQSVDTEKEIEVYVFDKYSAERNEIYYYLRWGYEGDMSENELLILYNTKEKAAEIVTFENMNSGSKEDIRAKWDELKYARADRMFSPTEIEQIVSEAERSE